MIVLMSISGGAFLGALTAALVFFRAIVGESEVRSNLPTLIAITLTLAIGVPFIALMSFGDMKKPDGTYLNGIVGQYLPFWSLLAYLTGFLHAWLAVHVFRQRPTIK